MIKTAIASLIGVSTSFLLPLILVESAIAETPTEILNKPTTTNRDSSQKVIEVFKLDETVDPLKLPTKPEEIKLQGLQSITLQQAIALAQSHNRELQIAERTLQRSEAVLRQAQASELPALNLETEFANERDAKDTLDGLKRDEIEQSGNLLTSKLELSYDLFNGGRRSAKIAAAEATIRSDSLEVSRLREQVRLDVTNAYYDLQEASEQLRITQAATQNAQKSLSDAEALEKGGRVPKYDILRSKVQLANAEQELVQAQSALEISRRQLLPLLGLVQSIDFTASDPVQQGGQWQYPLEDSIILAFKNRPELEQQLSQRQISEQQRIIALSETMPQIGLFANYQIRDNLSDRFRTVDGYAVGVRLRWNLFDGGAARSGAQQEEANKAIAETRFADTRNQIRFQVEQAYKNLQANAKNIQTSELALKQAKEGLEIARLQFKSEVNTQLDVIVAENELTRAEVNRLKAILNYNRALAALQRSVSNKN
jgi:outer membrane protein TolC